MPNPITLIAALAFALLASAVGMRGPSDMQAAQATAATAQDAQAQARQDEQLRAQVDHLAAAIAKGRPGHISPADWAASVKAVSIAQGGGE